MDWVPKGLGQRDSGRRNPEPPGGARVGDDASACPPLDGRSLRAGWEEPDSQALCVSSGPRADSPEAPGSVAGPVRPP